MDIQKTWQAVLSELELSVSRGIFFTFFSKTDLTKIENGVATISSLNPYISSMLEERYYNLISSALAKHLKTEKISLLFVTSGGSVKKEIKEEEIGPLFQEQDRNQIVPVYAADLRGDFTFENFAVSGSNQLAYAAAEAVARTPGTAYNPFFLWGGVGVGKTHLMQAVGWAILRKSPTKKIIYCAGEDFTNEIVEAIRQKKTANFKSRYRSADVLLIDDVQFIAGKDTVQEEFFHTFNTIHRNGGQIILTSDRAPSEIAKLEDRLRSRFEGGMTVDISPPDFELRTAILLIKSKQKGKEISIEVAKIIAENIGDNRKLEGTLTKLMATAEMKHLPITEELTREVIGLAAEDNHKQKRTTPNELLGAVCEYYGLKSSQIKGEKRDKPIAVPRQILMFLLRTELDIPYMEIGEFLGGRDHSTIMHGVDKIAELLPTSEKIKGEVAKIRERIGEK